MVDDGGDGDLAPVVAPLNNVRLVRQANAGPAAARNRGVEAACGDFLAFTDDDCLPDPGWLDALVVRHDRDPEALIGGRVENLHPESAFSEASQALCNFLCEFHGRSAGKWSFFPTNNLGCSRRGFEAIGGFDVRFRIAAAEDRDFGMRWRRTGRPLVFAPEALVGHAHLLSLRGFLRQHTIYGRGARILHRKMRARGERAFQLERSGFYLGLIAHPFRSKARRPLLQCLLFLLSQAATAVGYFDEALFRERYASPSSDVARP